MDSIKISSELWIYQNFYNDYFIGTKDNIIENDILAAMLNIDYKVLIDILESHNPINVDFNRKFDKMRERYHESFKEKVWFDNKDDAIKAMEELEPYIIMAELTGYGKPECDNCHNDIKCKKIGIKDNCQNLEINNSYFKPSQWEIKK